jgi:hypothetical protein
MGPFRSTVVLCLFFTFLLSPVLVGAAEKSKEAPPAPIPPQIIAAKKIFIANAGGEDSDAYSGGRDRTYNQFYAAMKSWGRYEIVSSPGEADLLCEIQFVLAPFSRQVVKGDSTGPEWADPQFRLIIRDVKTNAALWAIREHAAMAILQSNRDKNFDEALAKLIDAAQKLAPLPQAPGAAPSH